MVVVPRFPDNHDFVYRHETLLAVAVFERKQAVFNFQYFATQIGRSTTIDVELLSN